MKKISIFIIGAMLLSMLGAFGFGVSAAADPALLIDYSDSPILNGVSGNMDYNFVNDGDFRVMEVVALAADTDFYNTYDMEDVVAGDATTIEADTYQWVKMEIKNVSVCPIFEFHFGGSALGVDARCCTHVDISTEDTAYKTYVFNMKERNKATFPVHPNADFSAFEETSCWTGTIDTFRTDFGYIQESGGMAPEGVNMYIKYIAIFDSEEAANAWTYTPIKTAADFQPTEAPETTAAPETEPAETTTTAEATQDNETTTSGSSDSEDGGSMVLWIVIAVVAVVAIIVVIVLVSSKKKK